MAKLKYQKQLEQPEWKLKRKKILERDVVCQFCFSIENLQVHHLYYIDGNLAWEYPDEALITLCENCHTDEHLYQKQVYETIDNMLKSGIMSKEILHKLKIG